MESMKRTEAASSEMVKEKEAVPISKDNASSSSIQDDKAKEHEPPSNEDSDSTDSDDDDEGDDDEGGEKGNEDTSGTFQIPQRFTKSGRKRSVPFPVRLMKVLSEPKFAHIIEWLPSGKSFVIHKPKVFATDILPAHFKSAKYSSFTRKLHRWGFVRHFRGGESGAFFHDDFQKGRLDLAEAMTCCQQQKEAASKTARKARQKVMHEHSPARNALRPELRPSQSGHNFPVLQQSHSHTLESMMHPPFASSSAATLERISGLSGLGSSTNATSGFLSGLRHSTGLRPPMMDSALHAAVLEQQILKERYDAAIQDELTRLEYSRLAKERLQDLQRARLLQQQQLSQQLGLASGAMGVLPSSSSLGSSSLAPMLSQLSRAELERYALAMASRQGNTGGGASLLASTTSSSSPRGTSSALPYDPLRNNRPSNSSSFLPP